MNIPDRFPCMMVRQHEGGAPAAVETISVDDLPPGDVLIRVAYTSLNYKDALACQAHPGVVSKLPHIPGIDCAGTVVESTVAEYKPGDSVLVTGYGLGSGAWGGFSQYVRVPASWVVPLPANFTPRQAMTYGTAGFTAAQCVQAIQRQGIQADRGEVVVTGATGGVGLISTLLLSHLGYHVVAVTGKQEQVESLRQLGADRVLPREEVSDTSNKPLLPAQWSAAVDTVGGNTLATLLRSMQHRGCVAACGLVGGPELPLTVYPFILRGVTLAGIDSAKCPREPRLEIWNLLAHAWNVVDLLDPWTREIGLTDVMATVELMMSGRNRGRVLVRPE